MPVSVQGCEGPLPHHFATLDEHKRPDGNSESFSAKTSRPPEKRDERPRNSGDGLDVGCRCKPLDGGV